MKVTNYASAVAFALLYSSEVSAVQLEKIVGQFVPEENVYVAYGSLDDPSYNEYDKEYKPSALAQQLEAEKYTTKLVDHRPTRDLDGDGVEDNQHKTAEELDRHYNPAVFGVDSEIHNTRHGNPPGMESGTDHPEPVKKLNQKDEEKQKKPVEQEKMMTESDEIVNSVYANNDSADSFNDKAYLQLDQGMMTKQDLLHHYVQFATSPEALEDTTLLGYRYNNFEQRNITDEDGDGVEDNIHFTHDELDRFYLPNRFPPTEHIYNTRHGGLPGHRQKYWYDHQGEPEDGYRIIKHDWQKW